MPRFFFDFYDGPRQIIDRDGLQFLDRADARNQAVKALAEGAADALPGGDQREFLVRVRDESGKVIFKAALAFSSEWPAD